MPEGFGSVSIELSQGSARTAMPAFVLNGFDHIDYLFAREGEEAQARTPDAEGRFVLEPGSWTATVNAYVMPEEDSLAAWGTEAFALAGGTHAPLVITMRPVTDGGGAGSFKFLLDFPGDAVVETFTLTRIAGDEIIDLKAGFNSAASGEKNDVPSGYYLLRLALKRTTPDSAWAYARVTEVVHICQNLTTETDARRYAFTDDDFDVRRVTNANDSGPGSLRQAILDANEEQAIQVLLPQGSVIQLASSLAVSKSLAIEGNGVVLAGAAPFFACGGANKTITIRRVHFYGGGTAITKSGTASLAVDSCIFDRNGGAISSTSGSLTVQACTFYKNGANAQGGTIYAGSGIASLAGNLFYGNALPIVAGAAGGAASSGGSNVCDAAIGVDANESGWVAAANDTRTTGLPLSGKTFRVFEGSAALGRLPSPLPPGYPVADFYGDPVLANGASGAVQSATPLNGYFLEVSVNNTALGSASVEGLSEDGLASGPVTLTATASAFGRFRHWEQDGLVASNGNPYTVTLSAHAVIRAVFGLREVADLSDGADAATTPGTLRYALANTESGQTVSIAGVTPGATTIELGSPLSVREGITLEGNGITLTRGASFPAPGSNTPLLNASGGVIRRVHFKDGRADAYGAAVYGRGTLESCIFSGNRSNHLGGVIHGSGQLTVRGCTFFNNKSEANEDGVIYLYQASAVIAGNLFFGNVLTGNSKLVYPGLGASASSGGYNVCDVAIGTAAGQSGYAAEAGDIRINSLPLSGATFRLLPGSAALNRLPSPLPAGYPATDFYGDPVQPGGAAGAVQALASGSGYVLNLSGVNPLLGSASAAGLSGDGFASGPVILTATPSALGQFRRWEQDGAPVSTANPYTFAPSAHCSIRAVFSWEITDLSDGSGAGTLRHALANAEDGDIVNLAGVVPGETVMELDSGLTANKSVVIEGNGIAFTRGTGSPAAGFAMLTTSGVDKAITLRRIHFTEGMNSAGAPAIENNSSGGIDRVTLTLESCIFSGNRSTGARVAGGVINTHGGGLNVPGPLTVRACTFYNNSSAYRGGAMYLAAGTVALTGNLFYGNTTAEGPIVYVYGGTAISGGYNLSNLPYGAGYMQTGFSAATGDARTGLSFYPLDFRPLPGGAALGKLPAVLPEGYPAVDFYGNTIGANGAAGAVQAPANMGKYYLEIQTDNASLDYVEPVSGLDGDGFGSGPVTVRANISGSGVLLYWELNGAQVGHGMNPYTFNLTTHSTIRAVTGRTVTDHGDNAGSENTPGTLRHALAQASDNTIISIEGVSPGTTVIELGSPLTVAKEVVIEGNGVTLRGHSLAVSAQTTLRRVHFENVPISQSHQSALLTLESCVFSGTAGISSSTLLTVRGCTFFNSNIQGSPELAGNILYGTTTGGTSGGHNVCDAALGTGAGQSGFVPAATDIYVPAPVVHPVSFRPLPGGAALNRLPAQLPENYPAKDFYGNPVPGGGAAGAIQEAFAGTGSYLEITVNNSALGSVEAPGLSADGFGSGTLSVTAVENTGGQFLCWEMNDANAGSQNPLSISLTAPRRIRAVFGWKVSDFTDTPESQSTPGTLRHAVTNAPPGETIRVEGGGTNTILLTRRLVIEKSLVIEGNGVTLQWAMAATGAQSQLLYVGNNSDDLNVTLRRIRFKDGQAASYGGAIYNNGKTLALESCIFSGNQTVNTDGLGGAVYTAGDSARLTIQACTFFRNSAGYRGGAIYVSGGMLALTGNLFYGNATPASTGPVVFRVSGSISSGGYNVCDVDIGTAGNKSGWVARTGDATFAALGIAGDPFDTATFVPVSGLGGVIQSAPQDFPAVDFNGAARTFPGAPGAVKQQ
jgi:predicted outer membrane repeat protein